MVALRKLSGLFCAAIVLGSLPALAAPLATSSPPVRTATMEAPALRLESTASTADVRSYADREAKSAKDMKALENFKGGHPAVVVVPVGVVVVTVVLLLVLL